MPVYYYVDLYYDPAKLRFGDVVNGCISAMLGAGSSFKKVVMSSEGLRRQVTLGDHVCLGPYDIGKFAAAYAQEMINENQLFISFPPLGRVLFEYDFRFDEAIAEEVEEEETDSRSSARTVGLNFTYSEDPAVGRRIKASLSLWEEYILTYGDRQANRHNMMRLLQMVLRIYDRTRPYFGAMNDELHLDTDGAYEHLLVGELPAGNEFALIGKARLDSLNREALKRSGLRWKELSDGGVLIQFQNRWEKQGGVTTDPFKLQ